MARPPARRLGPQDAEKGLVWVAQQYYLEQRSLADIADVLGVSAATISRRLAHARAAGIVEFRVCDPRDEPID